MAHIATVDVSGNSVPCVCHSISCGAPLKIEFVPMKGVSGNCGAVCPEMSSKTHLSELRMICFST